MASRIALFRAGLALAASFFVALSAGAAEAAKPNPDVRQLPMNRFVDWEQTRPGRNTVFRAGELTVTMGGRVADRVSRDPYVSHVPVIQVRSPDGANITIEGVEGNDTASATIGVARLDPVSPYPQVVFVTSTRGANCCYWIWVLDHIGGRWRALKMGRFHGTEYEHFPVDEDGDGRRELVLDDTRYYNAFCPSICTIAPAAIYRVHNGALIDVSAEPRYRPLHAKYMMEAKAYCDGGDSANGMCAGFVAEAARAGRFQWAWDYIVKNYAPRGPGDRGFNLIGCRQWLPLDRCRDPRELHFNQFPAALRWFLGETGYRPRVPVPDRAWGKRATW